MSVEPFSPDETTQVEPFDPAAPPPPATRVAPGVPGPPAPDEPGGTPEGLGSERAAAPYTSETSPSVQGVAEDLDNTGFDQSEKADPV